VRYPLKKRQQGLPAAVIDISWKAQVRLCHRYRRLVTRGKTKQKVVIAVARELLAFMWAIGVEVETHQRQVRTAA
jgi:transposase